VIKHLLGREPNCPKVLAATHFHEVFTTGRGMLDPDETPATFLHMQVLLNPGRGLPLESETTLSNETSSERHDEQNVVADQDGLTYLYRYWRSHHVCVCVDTLFKELLLG
jgi:DNA mismatch repair protein MSH5